MIRITATLIPGGDESQARTLGTIEIANEGSGDELTGNYLGTLHAEYTGETGRPGRVLGFHRKTQSVWSLVGAFLKLWGHTKHSPKLLEQPAWKNDMPDLFSEPVTTTPKESR